MSFRHTSSLTSRRVLLLSRRSNARSFGALAEKSKKWFRSDKEDGSTHWTATSVGALTLALGALAISSSSKEKTTHCRQKIPAPEPRTPNNKQRFQVNQTYQITDVLGEGAYGKVYRAKRHRDGVVVALKSMNQQATQSNDFEREIQALKVLSDPGHPHVCRLFEQHQDEKQFYLAMELIGGGEVFEHLIAHGPYSEKDAATLLKQFAEALSYIHSKGLIHADLKPENLMMDSWDETSAKLKVVDFGCTVPAADSKNAKNSSKLDTVGTIAYLPPEMLQNKPKLTKAVDMFATGVIMYILLTGSHPFDATGDKSDKEVSMAIQRIGYDEGYLDKFVFNDRTAGLNESCVSLMRSLMHPNPNLRPSSAEFQFHPWIQGSTASPIVMENSDQRLQRFWQKRFRAAILKKYAAATEGGKASLSDSNLKHIFQSMDLDGNGELSPAELKSALCELLGEKNVQAVFDSLDADHSGSIDFDEFKVIMRKKFEDSPGGVQIHENKRIRAAILQKFAADKRTVSKDDLREVFDAIDLNGDGTIQISELRQVLGMLGLDDATIADWVSHNVVPVCCTFRRTPDGLIHLFSFPGGYGG
jgi:serine/threonine protein kinase